MLAKRGQTVTFGNATVLVLTLVVIALVAAAGGVGLASFQASQSTGGVAYNISGYGLTSLLNFGNQLGTIGTMLGVGLILATIIGVFAYFQSRQSM